ncbi:MAG TPA: hypothetical protein DIT13_17410 [Verrucomicrobiales bacterium]|nr:hypothetical protein [Verrucomicrobiales bacterium]HRJ07312.1 hypothetical protein [Prosthecobacter sp.]HRK14077.1 hypothetical protein [Prosthecobacter sp.]
MKTRTLLFSCLLGTLGLLHAQEDQQAEKKARTPGLPFIVHDEEIAKQTGPEAAPHVRSYSLGFLMHGQRTDEGRQLQRTALDLISWALKSNHTPATHEDSLFMHCHTSVLIARVTEAQHAIIADTVRVLKENQPDRPAAAIAPAPANSIVRIYALSRIFGVADSGDATHQKERAAKTDALISQIRTSMAMARLDKTMPKLSFHGSSNSLIAKGTAAQMELITQAITAWRENTPDFRTVRGQ